jgi:hypothetical protein
MGLTKYPNGVSSFGMPIIGIGSETLTTGNVFFVDSTHSNASDGNDAKSPENPAATIDGCIAKCTANNGDIIFVMPNHDEDPTSSITMDVAGVWIRGVGHGNSRPTVTFGAQTATVAMSAASTRISNIVFDLGTVAATVDVCFTITASACIVEECEIKLHATSQFVTFVSVSADSNNVMIRNNRFIGLHTASGTSGLLLDGCDYISIVGNYISGHFGEHALDNTTGSLDEILRAYIVGNIIENKSSTVGDLCVEMDDDSTGVFAGNLLATGLDFEAGFNPGNMSLWENYMWDADDTSGAIIPTAPSTS